MALSKVVAGILVGLVGATVTTGAQGAADERAGTKARFRTGAKEQVFWAQFGKKAVRAPTHGYRLEARRDLRDAGDGIPVTFKGGGLGLLTPHLLVAGLDHQTLAQLLPGSRHIEELVADERLFRITLATPEEVLSALTTLEPHPGVAYVHPDFRFMIESRSYESPLPEPYQSNQWHFSKTGVEQAWTITKGSPQTVVALIDLGFEEDHHDLR